MRFLVFLPGHLQSTSGIICGLGSFAVGDHFRRCTGVSPNNPNEKQIIKGGTFE